MAADRGANLNPRRVVVFTGSLSYSVRKGIVEIDEAIQGLQWLIVVATPRRSLRQLMRSQVKNVRRNGWRWLPYQAAEVLSRAFSSRLEYEPVAPVPGHGYTATALSARRNVCTRNFEDIHAQAALKCVQDFQPDLGISLAAPILRRALFAIPRLGTINLHKGKLPDFRGMPPAFWELWHDASTVGCSVHCVDDKLDTGHLLAETVVQRSRYSSVKGLQLELDEVAIGLTRDAVRAMLNGSAKPKPQLTTGGSTFRKPTLAQQAQLRGRLTDPVPLGAAIKTIAKDGVARAILGLSAVGIHRMLKARAMVLLYHRVSDEVRDNLTVGLEQFDRQMSWVAKSCQLISVDELVAIRELPRTDRPLVAVTFDDGYFDNYLHAAPILRRHGVPAAFFISTGIVDSENAFPHDLKRGNPAIAKMSWAQLIEMRRWGFTIGSHTVNHIDCASEPEPIVRQELEHSRRALEERLGVERPIFAYPYGGKQHMTVERLAWVKDAGYAACLSAYGGTNVGSIDPFNVMRTSISHEFSDLGFKRSCMGLL